MTAVFCLGLSWWALQGRVGLFGIMVACVAVSGILLIQRDLHWKAIFICIAAAIIGPVVFPNFVGDLSIKFAGFAVAIFIGILLAKLLGNASEN